jgi:anti-sigma regulatory factor (Ser/Thr protein kinase)
MTEGAHQFSHHAALYERDPEGADMLLPFLTEGMAAHAPTILMVEPALDRAIGKRLGQRNDSLIRLRRSTRRPLAALQRDLGISRGLLDRGAREVRIVASVPHPGTGASDWSGWFRLESAVNHFFADLPVARCCAYDLRTTPRYVVDDVYATHPSLVDRDGTTRLNPAYVAPETLLVERSAQEVDPLEESPPVVELRDPSTDQARAAVADVASEVPLRTQDVSALCVAADEAVTNARRHGRGLVTTRIWRGPNRVAVAVTDEGSGPPSPFAGMVAGAGRQGMWLLHQLCTRVSTTRDPDGFTVHLVAQADVPRRG